MGINNVYASHHFRCPFPRWPWPRHPCVAARGASVWPRLLVLAPFCRPLVRPAPPVTQQRVQRVPI